MAEISSHFVVFLADPGLSAATESLVASGVLPRSTLQKIGRSDMLSTRCLDWNDAPWWALLATT